MNIEFLSISEAIDNFNLFIALGLFILYAFVEALDASLTLSITRLKSWQSANKVLILYVILGIEIFALVSNYLYIVPVALGAWVGTYLLLEKEKKVESKKPSKR